MEKEALKRIFDFLEDKEEKKPRIYGSIAWKILFNDPIIKEDLIVQGDLDISTLNITHLPKGLKIIGNADFRFLPRMDNDVRPGMFTSGGKNEKPVFAKDNSRHCLALMTSFIYLNVSPVPFV